LHTIMIAAVWYLSHCCEVLAVGRAPTIFQNDWFCTRISNFFQSPIFSIARLGIDPCWCEAILNGNTRLEMNMPALLACLLLVVPAAGFHLTTGVVHNHPAFLSAGRLYATLDGKRRTISCHLESDSLVDRRAALLGAVAASVFVSSKPRPASAQELVDFGGLGTAAQGMGKGVVGAPWEGIRKPVPTWKLEGGVEMPTLALNTVALGVEDTARAVSLALATGISHIDFHPGVERDGVAKVIASGVDPKVPLHLFLCSQSDRLVWKHQYRV